MPYSDKDKQREYQKEWARKNRDRLRENIISTQAKIRARNKSFINDYLQNNPCVDCGETDTVVLEFDHVRGDKSFNVGYMSNGNWSLAAISKEIDKCDVRCCNCHRRKTIKNKDWMNRHHKEIKNNASV